MLKKSFISFMVLTLLFAFTLPSIGALAAPNATNSVQSIPENVVKKSNKNSGNETTVNNTDEEVEAAGKLGFLIKLALEVVEAAFKYGGDAVSKVLKYLDADTAKYVKSNSSKIASGIDKANKKIDEAEDYVHDQLSTILQDAMSAAGVSKTYRVPIADAIASVVLALA